MKDVILYMFYAVLVLAALQDLATLKISNIFPALVLVLFCAWLFVNGVPATIWQNGMVFVVTFGIGTLLFAIHWLGGGDVKLLAASSIWFGLSGGLLVLAYVALCGGVLGLALILGRRMTTVRFRRRLGWPGIQIHGPIPYGLAIAAGVMTAIMTHGPNPTGLFVLTL
jgi:prepilin peptidase CpaA